VALANWKGIAIFLSIWLIVWPVGISAQDSMPRIVTNALHPYSLMNTDMVLEAGIEPRSSVETGRDALLRLINDDVGTGKYFRVFEEARARPQAYETEAVARLMEISADLVSMSDEDAY